MKHRYKVGAAFVGAIAALVLFGPYEPVETDMSFDAAQLDAGVSTYLAKVESRYDDIRPDSEKRVIWAGDPEQASEWAVVYLHGFSASSQETRPVPDRVAEALGANLVFTRFRGHGRDGDAMAEATVGDWMRDAGEALAIGRRVGKKTLVISTSTGGTIAALAALDEDAMRQVAGLVMVAPNFALKNRFAAALAWPAARYWLPLLADPEYSSEPYNERHGREWTTAFPSLASLPMAALVKHASKQDYSAATVPGLFYYSDADQVVSVPATEDVISVWGGPVQVAHPKLTESDDPGSHVITGDIRSPGTTEATIELILNWVVNL